MAEKYIIRRLTPRECERLQAFPDDWTLLPEKESMTDEELQFWNDVRANKAAIMGKQYKPLSERSMVKRYNSIVKSDSNRYKALGNSIACTAWIHILDAVAREIRKD